MACLHYLLGLTRPISKKPEKKEVSRLQIRLREYVYGGQAGNKRTGSFEKEYPPTLKLRRTKMEWWNTGIFEENNLGRDERLAAVALA
jgi:hypothetical protein